MVSAPRAAQDVSSHMGPPGVWKAKGPTSMFSCSTIFWDLVPGFVSWALGVVFWVLGFVFWVLGFVFWVLGIVFWVLGIVFWVLGIVFWMLEMSFGCSTFI